jgi:hypothetical protein
MPLHFPPGAMFSFSQEKRKTKQTNETYRTQNKDFIPIFLSLFLFTLPRQTNRVGKKTERNGGTYLRTMAVALLLYGFTLRRNPKQKIETLKCK